VARRSAAAHTPPGHDVDGGKYTQKEKKIADVLIGKRACTFMLVHPHTHTHVRTLASPDYHSCTELFS